MRDRRSESGKAPEVPFERLDPQLCLKECAVRDERQRGRRRRLSRAETRGELGEILPKIAVLIKRIDDRPGQQFLRDRDGRQRELVEHYGREAAIRTGQSIGGYTPSPVR